MEKLASFLKKFVYEIIYISYIQQKIMVLVPIEFYRFSKKGIISYWTEGESPERYWV